MLTTRTPREDQTPTGLYDPAYEHDACGVGFVADVTGTAGRRALAAALRALDNLVHRGAVGADARTSDGAGVLTGVPAGFFQAATPALAGRPALGDGELAVGVLFLPSEPAGRARGRALVEAALARQGLPLLGWRDVPVAPEILGAQARAAQPAIVHALAGLPADLALPAGADEFERRLLLARREVERRALDEDLALYVPSFSARTLVYKGLLAGGDLAAFYPDLADPRYVTAFAVFHQRYSTNTLPTWQLAQPFRLLAHNGEINTVQGNRRWMAAREPGLSSPAWGDRLADLRPIVQPGGSDSASLDNVLELLVRSGRDPLEATALLVGEAWEGRADLDPHRRAFYAYHAPLMEPWDGPAALAFADGRVVGAALDRNGLRPARYRLTADDLLVVASEAGVLEPAGGEPAAVLEAGRLGPGRMIAVDLARGRLLRHDDILGDLAARRPYRAWVAAREADGSKGTEDGGRRTEEAASVGDAVSNGAAGTAVCRLPSAVSLAREQRRHGYTAEDLRLVLTPMGAEGHDAVWSMGDDAPPAVLSAQPRPLADYFRQRFAQVTNPPIDPLRERLVMALDVALGPRAGLLDDGLAPGWLVHLPSPVLTPAGLAGLRDGRRRTADSSKTTGDGGEGGVQVVTLPALFDADGGGESLASALAALQAAGVRAVDGGATILIVSNRAPDDQLLPSAVCRLPSTPVPALLAVAAVHRGLIAAGRRLAAEVVAEAGDAWTVHHLALLLAYGAAAVCPWLGCASVRAAAPDGDGDAAERRYVAALEEGLLKVLSKMGISTMRSYHGSGLFEALGLGREVVDAYFPGTPSPLGGIGLAEIAAEARARQEASEAPAGGKGRAALPDRGFVRFRRDGERHAYAPTVVRALQAVAAGDGDP
ncbi:MAG TPA: glutamate synthase central domain-containing protein, partial [Thermomicrobiales bacterium]|nr:glutamate synthase central domain-containing protein [Thermomicrobiales bacterium]